MTRRTWAFRAMLVALGIDNFGSGLFLPLTLIYLTRIAGIPLLQAGVLLSAGTVVGTLMPAIAARQIDRRGAGSIVCASQVLQGVGMLAYLVARELAVALIAAVLVAAGTQLFYAALGAMTSDAAGDEGQDRAFALVGMIRAGAFGLGGLVGGLVQSINDGRWLPLIVALDAASFFVAAAALYLAVAAVPHPRTVDPEATVAAARSVPVDRSYLLLLATTFLLMLGVDLYLVAMPLYAADHLHAPGWAIGACFMVSTGITATLSAAVVRRTAALSRTTCLALGAGALIVWSVAMASLMSAPPVLRGGLLVAVTVVFACGNALVGPRLSATLAAIAPPHRKGAYFAYMQYAFTAAALLAPLAATLMHWSATAPWILNTACLLLALAAITRLRRHLPAHALSQQSALSEAR